MTSPQKICLYLFCIMLSFVFPVRVHASIFYKGIGYDVSYPNCAQIFPKGAFGIVGANYGKAFTKNPCLSHEFSWANTLQPQIASLYMNLNAPIGSTASRGLTGPSMITGTCLSEDQLCQSFNYGYHAAEYAYTYALESRIAVPFWWLDIETENSWFDNPLVNVSVIRGAIAFFRGGISPNNMLIPGKGLSVGVYSTPYMWQEITNGSSLGHLPSWIGTDDTSPPEHCPESFT